jgi:FG-GAP repeat
VRNGGKFARLAVAVLAGAGLAVCAAVPALAGSADQQLRGPQGGPGSGLTLARAPSTLQAAVHRTLGVAASSAVRARQQAKLTASDRVPGDRFGYSVAVSGSTALVSANGKAAVYVFVRSGKSWSQQAKLTAANAGGFGTSVALSGSTAVIGAPYTNIKKKETGAAYVFVRSGKSWSQQAKLTASDGDQGSEFGYSVAISGSTAVIGAYFHNYAGAAYVFTRSGTAWSQQSELTPPAGSGLGTYFGGSVAVSGSTVVVGAFRTGGAVGAAYVFVRSGTAWSRQAKLTASDGVSGDLLGSSVAISGSTAVIAAPGNIRHAGAAYVFTRSGTAWSQQAELTAPKSVPGDVFASSVAIFGSTAVVGEGRAKSATGAAYVFTQSGASWPQQAKLIASDGVRGDTFGHAVAISGSTAVVCAPGKNSATGAAYVFVLPPQQANLTASGAAA